MIEVILDTETTGLSISEKHRIIEIGCIELENQIPTKKIFHAYINPERQVSADAYRVHGYSNEFLKKKKIFKDISEDFLNFIKNKQIIIHNADFDLSFLNYELRLINKKGIDRENIIDTLKIAREKFPGAQNSLDALCKRFNIDNSKREKHSALIDCELLKEVYINLVDQKEPKLKLESSDILNTQSQSNNNVEQNLNISSKIIQPSKQELESHKKYLTSSLPKNYFN